MGKKEIANKGKNILKSKADHHTTKSEKIQKKNAGR
jgi:hypothetical protein